MQTLQQPGFVSIELLKRHLSPELVISSGLCSECFSPLLLLHDGRWLCPNCKIEYDGNGENIEDDRVPFPQGTDAEKGYFESHFNPANALAFSNNMGTQTLIKTNAIAKVIARKDGGDGNRDLGLRARQIKILVEHDEPETLRRALQRGSEALKAFGFEKNMMVGNTVGQFIRKLYAYLALTKTEHFNSRWTADCCVFYTLRYKFFYEPQPKEKIEHGFVVTQILKFPEAYLRLCRLLDAQMVL